MPAESVYEELLSAVAAAIQAMSLTDSPQVVVEDAPFRIEQPTPYISVCPALQPETSPKGTNQRDSWVYSIQVSLIAAVAGTSINRVLGWRQAIRRRFNNTRITADGALIGGIESTCTVTPLVPIEPQFLLHKKGYLSILLVKPEIQENRS